MIEHTPDLIGFLNECESILKPGGVLSLAIPDKRYCFDHFRPVTGLGKIIDAHLAKDTVHSPGNVAEYFMNVVAKDGSIAWNGDGPGEYRFLHGLKEATWGIQVVQEQKAYLDIHAWCFVPSSFRLLVNDLNQLGFLKLKEASFAPTINHEFFSTLSQDGVGFSQARALLQSATIAELSKSNLILQENAVKQKSHEAN